MKRKITVTEQDIQLGRRANCYWCPIARAIKREFGLKGRGVNVVDDKMVYVGGDDWYTLSRAAQRFINRFDAKKPVQPLTFMLTA